MQIIIKLISAFHDINIRESELVPLGYPLKKVGFFGWDCLDCKYTGKGFFIVSKDEYKKILKEKFNKKELIKTND